MSFSGLATWGRQARTFDMGPKRPRPRAEPEEADESTLPDVGRRCIAIKPNGERCNKRLPLQGRGRPRKVCDDCRPDHRRQYAREYMQDKRSADPA